MRRSTVYARIVLFSLLPSLTVVADDSPMGSVSGTIVSEQELPVAGVKVTAKMIGEGPIVRAIRYVETDKEGHFTIDRLAWGDYKIYTRKDSEGYPNSASTLYSNGLAPQITLSPQSPSANLTVKLAPKAGIVKGKVTDAITGAAVNAGVRLWRISDPKCWLEKSLPSEYSLLVPADEPTGMEVRAEGYEPWYYPGSSKPDGSLTEGSGQTGVVNVRLTPLAKSP